MKSSSVVAAVDTVRVEAGRSGRSGSSAVNDLDLKRWKDYEDILTDSLWIIPERDGGATHKADYHGNFVPQIPYQMMMRYTRRGDVVLDPFLGSGTTLIECRRLGRHGIGIELQEKVCSTARTRVLAAEDPFGAGSLFLTGDSRDPALREKVRSYLAYMGRSAIQLVIAHPPYHDIIRFSDRSEDLSNAPDEQAFLRMFGEVLDNWLPLLEDGRYFVLVIGDKYVGGEWIPLGFMTMQTCLDRGLSLKSIIVKNMSGNRAKRNLERLWRYRALYGGFYIFKHEYVMVFRKKK